MFAYSADSAKEFQSFVLRLRDLAARLAHILLWPSRVAAARRTLSQLGGMSAFELADIGISRQDLVNFTARSLDDDPGQYLAEARASLLRRAPVGPLREI